MVLPAKRVGKLASRISYGIVSCERCRRATVVVQLPQISRIQVTRTRSRHLNKAFRLSSFIMLFVLHNISSAAPQEEGAEDEAARAMRYNATAVLAGKARTHKWQPAIQCPHHIAPVSQARHRGLTATTALTRKCLDLASPHVRQRMRRLLTGDVAIPFTCMGNDSNSVADSAARKIPRDPRAAANPGCRGS
jgi:hypothetical protein